MKSRDIRALIAVLLLPALATATGLWSMAHRDENFVHVPAAVVNLDEGATMTVDGEQKFVPFGRMLAGGLTDPDTADGDIEKSLDWNLVTKEDADEGLKNGTYQAVITIPKDFSSHLADVGTVDAVPAVISVESNQASNHLMGRISKEIAHSAAHQMGSELTEEMINQIFVGFADISESVEEAAEAAHKLGDGAGKLQEGVDEVDSGAQKLAGANSQIYGGATELSSGIDQLASKTAPLQKGISRLAQGAGDLDSGASALRKGVHEAKDGSVQLEKGTRLAADGTSSLVDGAKRLSTGTYQLYSNTSELETGITQLQSGAHQLADGHDQSLTGAQQLSSALESLSSGAGDLSTGTQQLSTASGSLVQGAQRLRDGLVLLDYGVTQTPATPSEPAKPGLLPILQALDQAVNDGNPATTTPALKTAAKAISDGLADIETHQGSLNAGLHTLETGVDDARAKFEQAKQDSQAMTAELTGVATECFTSGASPTYCMKLVDTLKRAGKATSDGQASIEQLLDGLDAALKPSPQSPGLVSGSDQLQQGITQLKNGAQKLQVAIDSGDPNNPGLAQVTPQLVEGALKIQDALEGEMNSAGQREGGLIAGANELATGTSGIQSGIGDVHQGVQALAAGSGQAKDGSLSLVAALNQLQGGAHQLADGSDAAHKGVIKFKDGSYSIYSGAQELASGTLTLKDKMSLLAGGAQALNKGLFSLESGTDQLAQGTSKLNAGAQELSTATSGLGQGVSALQDGAHRLSTGAAQARDGSAALSQGTTALHDGTGKLKSGSIQLADALKDGVDEIPVYSEEQRNIISQVGAQPIATENLEINKSANGATSSFALTMVLMAWLGAFAAYLLMPALRRKSLDSRAGAVKVMWDSLWPALAIGAIHIVLITIVGFLFNIQPKYFLQALLFMFLIGLAFITIHQMFLSLFGNRLGRVFSLLFFVIQGASLSGILPIETAPGFFQGLNTVLPLSLAMRGLQHYILGGHTVDTGWVTIGLLIWTIVSVVLVIASVPQWRARRFQNLVDKHLTQTQ